MPCDDEQDGAMRGWNAFAVVALAVVVLAFGTVTAIRSTDFVLLPLMAFPPAAIGSGVGFFSRDTLPGRLAAAGGLLTALLSVAAVFLVFAAGLGQWGDAR